MSGFDTIVMVDWSAGKRAPVRPSKDAIWIGICRNGMSEDPLYMRNRIDAESWLAQCIEDEQNAGRRVLIGFDFPFGYPAGFTRKITGRDDPFAFWSLLESQIEDSVEGTNNRFDVAETMNAFFDGPGPFWGKSHKDLWPGIPYVKKGIAYSDFAERRACDLKAKASSSCFQLYYNPTVGSQVLMGIPVLERLRRTPGVAVWPFQPWRKAPVVLAEIWPGVIEPAVKQATGDDIRDRVQVRLMAQALGALAPDRLAAMLDNTGPEAAAEAWILGAGHGDELVAAAVPPLRNDCFALPPGVHWTPTAEALALLETRLTPVTGTETLPLAEALGRIAAQDATARRANPPLPNTAVDGYGFAGGRPAGTHALTLAQGRAAAGDAPGVLPKDHALRVLTGAALPQGVDTVVLQEDVTRDGGSIRFAGPVKTGANTRQAGEDIKEGQITLEAGRRITAADLALLSATGTADVVVRQPLRVGVLSTGDELVDAGIPASPGQIYDANRPMLLGLVKQFGHTVVDLGRAPDDRTALRAIFDDAVPSVDLILTSGGASAGDEDHVSALLNEAGAMALWRIAIKPGRPLALGMWQGVPVFGLPGNPVAAMVCTLIFARPAMSLLAGAGWQTPQGFVVPAAFSKTKKAGRREYLRARLREGAAEVFASEGSGRISGLSWAEGLVELSEPAQDIRHGDPVRFIPFGSFCV